MASAGPSITTFQGGVQPGPNDVVIAVMGMTGAGKSSFISLCSGGQAKVGHDLQSCTSTVDTYPFIYEGPPRKQVFLVDTPGFDDSTRSDAEVLRELAAWLTASYMNKIRLSGIIYFHRINQPRMQGSAKRNILMFKKLCGDNALKNVILATTMWDITTEDVGQLREKQLLQNKDYWGYMASKGSKAYRHFNTKASAMDLIEHFISSAPRITLKIQEEMVNKGKTLDQTAAGQEVEDKLAQERKKFLEQLRNVESDLKKALKRKDSEAVEALNEMKLEYKKEVEQLRAEQENLRITMERLHQERYAQLEKRLLEQQGQIRKVDAFEKSKILSLARLCERDERFHDMAAYMKTLAELGEEFNVEERNLFSVAYKNVLLPFRQAWRTMNEASTASNQDQASSEYRHKTKHEIEQICKEVINLLDRYLIPNATVTASKVFYLKMKGDYYRYLAETSSNGKLTTASTLAHEAFKNATDMAERELSPTHPIRLGLALNYSVFLWEVLKWPQEALILSKTAFDQAISLLDELPEDDYRDTTLIMQLIRDNLLEWTKESD